MLVAIALVAVGFSFHEAGAEVFHVATQSDAASDENPGTVASPWLTLSHAAKVVRPGDTVKIHAGIYREQVRPLVGGTAENPITFEAAGDGEVVLSGADVAADWVPSEAKGVWSIDWPHRFRTHPNDEFHRLIGRCEQVIRDGELLKQVLGRDELKENRFMVDEQAKRLIVMLPEGVDPNDGKTEVARRSVAFGYNWGDEPRDHIHVRGLTFRYGSNTAQRGTLYIVGDHWLIEDCLVEKTNGSGISFSGDDVVFRRVVSRNNGQQGLGGGGDRFLLEDVRLVGNNTKGFNQSWEAGALKIVRGKDGVLRRCTALDNAGNGLWFDIDVRDTLVEYCYAEGNDGSGIFVEISGGFRVENNLCVGNGTSDEWGTGGIAIAESDNCSIRNNICIGNPTGIALRELGPRSFPGMGDRKVVAHLYDITITNNVCIDNSRYQVGLWWDNDFFGPHPSGARPDRPVYDPDEQNIRIDDNIYSVRSDSGKRQALALWGCPWRKKHLVYGDLEQWRTERRHDLKSQLVDVMIPKQAAGQEIVPSELAGSVGDRLQAAGIDPKQYGIEYPDRLPSQ